MGIQFGTASVFGTKSSTFGTLAEDQIFDAFWEEFRIWISSQLRMLKHNNETIFNKYYNIYPFTSVTPKCE